MATPERAERTADTVPDAVPDMVSMRDLLASCAAASAVSTPPREPGATADDGRGAVPPLVHDEAA
ncbi:hypothetical protein ACFY8W_10025 [Streptomyces sp. NPDC012637]|uniref:hypothetical protein n=1 Tax=unclassified Streptomyces TaxID=2593676 RepID=UPI0036E0E83A